MRPLWATERGPAASWNTSELKQPCPTSWSGGSAMGHASNSSKNFSSRAVFAGPAAS